jgi:hypothetical protein
MANREFRCAACGAQIFCRTSTTSTRSGAWVSWSGPQLCTDGKGHDPDPEAYGRTCG